MMMIKAAIALLSVALPSALAWTHHHVDVGPNGQLVYNPPYISADVGDKVTFVFHQKNHTATQSAFATPCSPLLGGDGVTHIGFSSGFNPVGANVTSDFPTASLTVLDAKPIWIYCQQTVPVSHCHSGMVFAVNPPTSGSNTFAAFQALAISSGNPSPGGSGSGVSPGGSGSVSPGGSGSVSPGGSHKREDARRYPRAILAAANEQ